MTYEMTSPSDENQLHLIAPPPTLTRAEGIQRLNDLVGQDLRVLGAQYGVTVWKDGRLNKGWAGQVVEHTLGLNPNSEQAADFGDWELKVVPVIESADGSVRAKESMAITMFTEDDILTTEFEDSHLLEKLGRLVVVPRLYVDAQETSSFILGATTFDLGNAEIFEAVRDDYEDIRWTVRDEGVYGVHGGIGRLIQPRVKGGAGSGYQGHGFYARAYFVSYILGLVDEPERP